MEKVKDYSKLHKNLECFDLRIFLILLFSFSSIISCKKYLDAKPDKKLASPTSLTDLRALLDNAEIMNQTSPTWDDASSDNFFVNDNVFNSLTEYEREAYKWQNKVTANYPNDWAKVYNVVYISNVVLENIEKIERNKYNENEWDEIKGAALVFRSQAYLKALWIWSKPYDENSATVDLGIPLRDNSDFNLKSERASVLEGYNFLLRDLKIAAQLLPSVSKHVMRPSKPAAYGYLARAYLSMRKYDSAFKYSDLCLKIKSSLLDYNSPDVNLAALTVFKRFNPEIIFNIEAQLTPYSYMGTVKAIVDSNLYLRYDAFDLRKQAYFLDGTRFGIRGNLFKGSYSTVTIPFLGLATDEIYLTISECKIRLGDKNGGLEYLNALLEKRWLKNTFNPLQVSSIEEALDLVLLERRKELVFRGVRWMDLKRLNKEGKAIVLKRGAVGQIFELNPNDNKYALPIPNDIIVSTGMTQNPS